MSTDGQGGNGGGTQTKSPGNKGADESLEPKLGPPEYLGYRILREREEQDGKPTSRSAFLKLCCIADRYLQDELGEDIEFPRHWYKYGEVGEPHSMGREFFNAPKARFWQGQEFFSNDEISEAMFEVSFEEKRCIRKAAKETVTEHGDKSAEELKRYQYERQAPNEFIQIYSHLRTFLEVSDSKDSEGSQTAIYDFDDSNQLSYIESLLDNMIISFPRADYHAIYQIYLQWDDTMRMLVEQDRSTHEMKVFLELFVEKLSESTLRFEHNHAIPEERLNSWEEDRNTVLQELNEGIERTRTECLETREQSGELESISEIYDKVILEDIF